MSAGPRALWIGPGAGRALAAGGEGEVAIAGGGFCYLTLSGDRWLHLAGARAVAAPLTIAVAGYTAPVVGAVVRGSKVGIAIDGQVIDLSRATTSPSPRRLPRALADAGAVTVALLPPPEETILGLGLLREGRADEAIAALAGRGPGLTPAGDDVLAGWAAWEWHEGRANDGLLAACAARTSPLSLAYLECAVRGELPEPVDRFLRALRSGAAPGPLGAWGDSSGLAAAHGVCAAGRVRHHTGGD